jgi:uncharacterized protein
MTDGDVSEDEAQAAGSFSIWLAEMQQALRGERDADVPCGPCTACCTSSQFVPIGPDEVDTLAHVPAELLFPIPRMPKGHVLLGYDERGHCPMLVDGGCSIYEHRPRTCRTYDCRVFPASGVDLEEGDKPAIAARARSWRFDLTADADVVERDALRAAARFVRSRADLLPDGVPPVNATQHAVLSVQLHDLFLGRDTTGRVAVVEPTDDEVRVEIRSRFAPR